jgi:hypothetical protein
MKASDPSPNERDAESITRLRAALDQLTARTDVDGGAAARGLGNGVAGAVPGPGVDPARPRRQPSLALKAAVALVALGLVAALATTTAWRKSGQDTVRAEQGPVGATSPSSTAPSSTAPLSTAPPAAVRHPTFGLRLEGATLVREETLTAALWTNADETAYLSLVERPGLAEVAVPGGGIPGGGEEATDFPADQGTAVFQSPRGSDHPTTKLWWARPDGDLWILSAHWQPSDTRGVVALRAELQEWALAIQRIEDEAGFELADSDMRLLAAEVGGELASRSRVWNVDGQEILLLALDGIPATGFANLLVVGWPEPQAVAGRDGWIVRHGSGAVLAWSTEGSGSWVTVSIPPGLADRIDEIAATLYEEKPAGS